MREPETKIMTLDAALGWRQRLRQEGKTLGITNGCFDLLHRGHTEYLVHAARAVDALLVAVNSDASVRAIKGPERPVVGENDRAFMLACLEAVDAVLVFSTPKPIAVFETLVPDVYIKGGDYDESTIDREEHAILKRLGCRFHFISFVEGFSTTRTIAQVKGSGS